MKLVGTTTELTKEFNRLMLNYNQYLWTVAWADYNFELSNLLVSKKAKIKKLCVGLHFRFFAKPHTDERPAYRLKIP
jgi:hypothetical protein